MPKVLRIINRFNLGGPTYNAAYLTKYLAPEFETLLVGGEKDESEESSQYIAHSLGLKPLIIPEMRRSINPFQDIKAYYKIKQLINDFKPDIVHTHAAKSGFLGRLAASNAKVPVVIHTFHGHVFHSYFKSHTTEIYKQLERTMAKRSDCIIAISEKQKHELSEVYKICPANKIRVIPLGFELDKFRENINEKRDSFRSFYKIAPDEIAIGIIGRLVPIKNHALFIKAINDVKNKTTKKVRCFIIGDGEERKNIEELAQKLNLPFSDWAIDPHSTFLTFTSWIKNIDWAMSGLDIIALTSHNEGTPVSLIEAQAANKPIVTTAVGGIENVVIPDKTALLVESGNDKEFSEKLLRLIENENLRNEMSVQGWDFVKNKFHCSRLVDDMRGLYKELLEKKR